MSPGIRLPCCSLSFIIFQVLELKKGIPITLSVVYSAVSNRLGVSCLPVGFPQHFLLKWLESPE